MTDKTCSKCGHVGDADEFPKGNWCKSCLATYKKQYHRRRYDNDPQYRADMKRRADNRRHQLKALIYAYKTGCETCDEDHPACLVFHHRNPSTKEIDLANAVANGYGRDKIIAEIAKCQVLCANCHRKLHWREAN